MTKLPRNSDPADRSAVPDRVERLLSAAAAHGAPVAADFLAELRERTTAEFRRTHQAQPLTSSRRWQMLFVRAVAAAIATAAVFSALWFTHNPPGGRMTGPEWAKLERPALAEKAIVVAFQNLANENFDAEIEADGVKQYVSGTDDGRLRFDNAEPGLYSIVHQNRAWLVDETANRAATSDVAFYYRRDEGAALNPWRLMELEPESSKAVDYREQEITENNAPVLLSYFNARYRGQPVAVETQIDPVKQLPRDILVWPRTNRGAQPLVRFHLTQAGGAADATKFKVAETLTEDGRIGKIIDLQGLVTVRALANSRWTPLYAPNSILVPGDWLRTDSLGANAATVQLAPQTKLIVGPGTTVELPKPDQLRIAAGVVQVSASEKTPVTLTGPDGGQVTIRGQEIWHVAQNKLEKVAKEPLWLKGYLGQVNHETLGSLIALVDGRNVPLTVGYHKVLVEIRDQIARTTIEESFVNHTKEQLEGQFYFPLPQDASISGFGMWIGDKLVEADIVEKQRAREIYEAILREKKDPGLLEWTGGNIFKARVFPIFPNSEKRIKITYTQVLPLVGDSYRYSYALQSDLLKQNPLRKLEVAVNIQSTQPLQQVVSPTHPTRTPLENSAHKNHFQRLEFSADNYTPTRDFEVVATLATRNKDLTLIPHRRGSDGYFMLLMQPPNQQGQWTRPLVNDGKPMELLILADTSASMDRASRTRQSEVIAALLGSLAPKDKFNLAVCDVDCVWAFEKSVDAVPEQITKARELLSKRRSMGWTNLQRGWDSALAKSSPGTQIVYVGDGVITRGKGDIGDDATALRLAAKDKNVMGHAIAVSSSFESNILKAIASVGGGSLRNAAGEVKPTQVAHDLLVEATRPALRNIEVTFTGFETQAVYPETLANVPAGTQEVVLGRFNPDSPAKKGEVVVRGTLDGKPVAYRADIELPPVPKTGSDEDASFIPRLWARQHLDFLLGQGASQETRDKIIALSEDYHIITPYTSLLILESDAQREQYKVKKRMQMRDGENFFNKSHDHIRYALIQQQLQQAQAWRQQLRQQLLDRLSNLGRDANQLQVQRHEERLARLSTTMLGTSVQPNLWFDVDSKRLGEMTHWSLGDRLNINTAGGLGGGGTEGVDEFAFLGDGEFDEQATMLGRNKVRVLNLSMADEKSLEFFAGDVAVRFDELSDVYGNRAFISESLEKSLWDFDGDLAGERFGTFAGQSQYFAEAKLKRMYRSEAEALKAEDFYQYSDFGLSFDGSEVVNGRYVHDADLGLKFIGGEARAYWDRRTILLSDGEEYAERGYGYVRHSGRHALLPVPFPYHVRKFKPRKIVTSWPAEAVAIIKSLQLEDDLRQLAGGLLIDRQVDAFHTKTAALQSRHEQRQLYSPKAWASRGDRLREQFPLLQWCNEHERGNQSLAFDLALVRKSDANDLQFLPNLLNDAARWDELLPNYQVTLERPAENRVLIIAKTSEEVLLGYEERRWLIDTERHVVLESERRYQDKVVDRTVYGKFVQVGRRWLATTAEEFNANGKRTNLATLQIKELNAADFRTAWDNEQKLRTPAITFQLPLPKLADAEKSVAANSAKLEDRLTLLSRQYSRRQWTEAGDQLDEAEKLAPGKAGWNWIRLVLLSESRRHEEAKDLLQVIADKTIAARHPSEFGIVHKLRQVSTQLTGGNEQLDLLATLQPAYQRFATPVDGEKEWLELRLESLTSAGRTDDYRDLLAQLTKKYPSDFRLQQQYVNQLRQSGDIAAALAWIEEAIARPHASWEEYEIDQLRTLYCDILESEGRYADAVTYCRKWETDSKAFEPNQRLLAYLVLSGQEKQAFDLAEAWLDQHVPAAGKPLQGVAYHKVYAAVQLLLGEGRNINRADLNPKYLPRLEKLLLQFAGMEEGHSVAMLIWNQNDFRNSPSLKTVHQAIFKRVTDEAGKLPLAELQRLFEIALWNVSTKTHLPQLQKIQTELERRWAAETKLPPRAQYRQLILRLCDLRSSADREKALRMFLAGARAEEKDGAVRELFDHLLNQSWTAEREAETLRLLDQLAAAEEQAAQTLTRVQSLYTWTDTMEQRRRDYLISKIDRPDKMKREDLNKLHEKLSRQAREEISQRLATAAAARQNNPLGRWMRLEHLTLEIRLDRNLPQGSDQLWNFLQQSLDTKALAAKPDAEKDDEYEEEVNVSQVTLDNVWQNRLLKSLLHLAAKEKAPPAQVQRLLKLFEEHQKLRAERLKNPDQAAKTRILNGQQLQYELLLARDMPKELQEALRRFIALRDETGHWRRQLARIYAELNKLEAGVQLLEELERADLLTSEDYRSLSVWYHALDQKEKHEAAQVKVYRFQQPWRLHSQLSAQLQRWRGTGQLPEKLDPKVLQMFAALLQTEDSPGYYITSTLTRFYEATHDTRLLHSLAKALPGHTAERVYPMLKESWTVLTKVEFEAVIDELIKGLDEVRATAKTDLDRRALDLLEALAHRRAAELQNGAQPHVDRALAAIQRAEKREWRTGEPQQMAEFLAGLGVISQPLLAAEQMRLLESMVTKVTAGTEAALRINASLATAHWNYGRHDQAINLLTAAAQQYQATNGGKVTQPAIGYWFTVVNWQDQRSQYMAAERTLTTLLPQVANSTLAQQMIHRRYDVYSSALRNNGLTSLGRGETLYRAALAASRADAREHTDLNFLVGVASRTIAIFEAAHAAKIASAAEDLIAYSKQDFPEILKRQVNGYDNSVNQMADAIQHVAGPKAGIAFLLQRVESEPVWVKYQGNDVWSRMSSRLDQWRYEVKKQGLDLGELEQPLLNFVIKELKRDLSTQNSHSRHIYHDDYGNFWKEKADAFTAAAEEVLKEQQNSSQSIMYIADYFYHGLDRRDRALEILLDANRRKILGHDQQVRLVYLLQVSNRYAESIPILESLIAQWPLELTRRCELMKAYFHTKQPQALARLQQEIHKIWHQENRWNEGVMQEFGEACLACELFEPAVEYLKEAVAAHTKATNGRSVGDNTLSRQYQSLAQAYAGMKNTKEAVDAASAAIVCWPRQINERNQALNVLRQVMRASPNLAAYVKQLDAETKEQDRPIVRKALGEVFQEQGKNAEAIVQYRAAVQLSPNDAELHTKLIECFDIQGDAAGALAQSFDSLELNRRNFELWQKLAERFDALKDATEAERARTSLAEVAPGETEGHTLLAQEREKQNRWEDALEQWQQVNKERSLEPAGLLNMARVQLKLKQKEAAAETIKKLEIKTWPEHTMEDYRKKMKELKEQLR